MDSCKKKSPGKSNAQNNLRETVHLLAAYSAPHSSPHSPFSWHGETSWHIETVMPNKLEEWSTKAEMPCTACLLCCLQTLVHVIFHQAAQHSRFLRFCFGKLDNTCQDKSLTWKLGLVCFSAQCHTQEVCLSRSSGWKYLGQAGIHPPSVRCENSEYGFEIDVGIFLKGRRQILFETHNWTVWIDPNRTYRICFKRYNYASICCNNKRNILEMYFSSQWILTSSFSTMCFSQKPPTLPARNNTSINVIFPNIHYDATYDWDQYQRLLPKSS